MYEEIITRCEYCRGTGMGEYVTEYGPFGFSVKDECHECEGEGIKVTLIDPYESKDFEY
jgi:DnaJ-class molecular chaperone